MQVVNFTEARNNLKAIFDTVYHNDEEVIVHRKNNENVAIISMEMLNRFREALNPPRIETVAEDDPDMGYFREARSRRNEETKTYTIDELLQEFE